MTQPQVHEHKDSMSAEEVASHLREKHGWDETAFQPDDDADLLASLHDSGEFAITVASPRPGTIHRYKDPNTKENEKSAKCKHCDEFIEDWGGEWRHSDTDNPACEVSND